VCFFTAGWNLLKFQQLIKSLTIQALELSSARALAFTRQYETRLERFLGTNNLAYFGSLTVTKKMFCDNQSTNQCFRNFILRHWCQRSINQSVCPRLNQGILKGVVLLYQWPPVWQVWNLLYDNWQLLFLFAKLTNPNQSNRRSMVQYYFPLKYSLVELILIVKARSLFKEYVIVRCFSFVCKY
jgi:hypothetical protein